MKQVNTVFRLAAFGLIVLCSLGFSERVPEKQGDFTMANNLPCVIRKSSDKKSIGDRISLLGLESDNPRVLFDSGVDSPMNKLFESNELLVIQLVASGSGSVDTIHLDKQRGAFLRTTSGIFLGHYDSHYFKGDCN